MNQLCSTTKDIVLVVDDSPETLAMLNDTLDSEGLTVLVALEGAQALTIAGNITPDLILLDAMMPNMDGFETCRRLKRNPAMAHTPVIFMTGLSDTESVVRGFEAGGVDYITKPVRTGELLARMRVHMANARLANSARAALDQAGQFLFACNNQGQLLWATPLAQSLLTAAGADSEWMTRKLPALVAPLLRDQRHGKHPRTLSNLNREISVHYLAQAKDGEHLLRLADPSRPSDAELLREAYGLTGREAEVLLWLGKGKTNSEIGLILDISPRTVNKHLEHVFEKLGAENRTTAAGMAIRCLNGE